jgi:hypothetical protein
VDAHRPARPTPRIFATTDDAHAYETRVWGNTVSRLESAQRQLLADYTRGLLNGYRWAGAVGLVQAHSNCTGKNQWDTSCGA